MRGAAADSRFKKVKPTEKNEDGTPAKKPESKTEPAKTKAIETNDAGDIEFTALTPTGNLFKAFLTNKYTFVNLYKPTFTKLWYNI